MNPNEEVDPNDPKTGIKLAYNKQYYFYALGHNLYIISIKWVGRSTGFEREAGGEGRIFVRDGHAGAREEPNPDGIERMAMALFLFPFDVKGTNNLNWRYRDARPDTSFAYVPAIRRVRRVSPSNRSDSIVGSDLCLDDPFVFDGKPNSMDWKIIGKREGLVSFLSPDPQSLEITETGAWQTNKTCKQVRWGYDVEGWQGPPWSMTNVVWAKRQMYVIQCNPKDPYYNYGTQEYWVDAEAPSIWAWKVINDRAGKYWKAIMVAWSAWQGPEEQQKAMNFSAYMCLDDRRDHASIVPWTTKDRQVTYFYDYDVKDFSLAGFLRFCK